MNVKVKWLDKARFVGESGSGHSVVMDGPPDAGGENLGVRPMEMVLIGLGGCAAFDVMLILKRGRQKVQRCEVIIDAERANTVPKVFTNIHMQFDITGPNLSEKQIARAVDLSVNKYCSVVSMLETKVNISHAYRVLEESTRD